MSAPPDAPRSTLFRLDALVVLFLVTLVYVGVVFLAPGNALQVPLGFIELLFAPGYALAALLFLRRPLLPLAAEFSVIVGLSVVYNVLIGLLLELAGAGLAIGWLVIADVLAVSAGVVGKAFAGETAKETGIWNELRTELRLPGVRPSYRRAAYVLLVAILVAFAAVVYVGVSQPPVSPQTALAVLGSDGTTSTLPANLTIGEVGLVHVEVWDGQSSGALTLGISATLLNRTANSTSVPWTLPLPLDPGTSSSVGLTVGYGHQTTVPVTFEFNQPGRYGLTFLLEATGGAPLARATIGVDVST